MALTAAEQVEVSFHAGYPAAGAIPTEVAAVIATLTAEGEARLRTRFLPVLNAMEQGIADSIELVDTKQAAVFIRNENELRERAAGYYWRRMSLCRFLGLDPGPALVLTDLPPFTTCCPRGATGGGGTTTPIDPTTGLSFTPAVYAV
jgi:hypothetical protein